MKMLSKNIASPKLGTDRINLYPWPLLWKTSLLWYSFFVLGLSDSIRGPTLLDLKDLINEDVSAVSSTFALRAFGGLIGCFVSGLILDSISPSSRYVFLAVATLVNSFCTIYFPFSPNLLVMQAVSVLFGLFNGSFHTAANVLLLRIWSGHNSSPYMYAMHFCFGLGALLAPILSKPFLIDDLTGEVLDVNGNEIFHGEESISQETSNFWTIQTLYPLVGITMLLSIPAYIYHFVQVLKVEKKEAREYVKVKNENNDEENVSGCKKYVLIALMAVYYFTFAGLESSFRNFTSAFAVSCSLNLTRHQAADVLAIFYSTFAVFRAIIIPLSAFASPAVVLWSSISMIGVATFLLSIFAESSLFWLQLGVALVGAGIAPLFASGMLWVKNVIPVTNKVGAVFTMGCSIGTQVYCMVIGSYIESQAMVFMYLMTGTLLSFALCFGLANIVANLIRREKRKGDDNCKSFVS